GGRIQQKRVRRKDVPHREVGAPRKYAATREGGGFSSFGAVFHGYQAGTNRHAIGPSLKARSESACRATSPVNSCHRRTITSQYRGSSSIRRAWRPVFSHAINVV